jgi:hypothetical protein
MRRILFLAVTTAVLLALPALASAATRYASPGGGETAPCAATAPCSLAYAITAAAVGDEVVVTSGTYSVTTGIVGSVPLTVRGTPGAGRPRIVGAAGIIPLGFTAKATVSDLTVEGTNAPEGALSAAAAGSVLERVEVVNSGTTPELAAVIVSTDWTVADSLIVAKSAFAIPFAALVNADGTGTLRNDTIVGEGEKTFGIAIFSGGKHTLAAKATNTIVAAGTVAQFQGAESMSSLAFDHSDLPGKIETGSPVTSTAGIAAAPGFVNAAANDYREATSSPTVDAGVNDPANGAIDLDGNTRALPGHLTCGPPPPAVTDIGAYELVPVAPPCAPVLRPPPAPGTYLQKAKIAGRTATFRFGSLTSPPSGFECKLDAKAWHTCTSPRTYKHLKPGRHTFRVRAFGAGGTDATPVVRKFKIRPPRHHHRHRGHHRRHV